MGRYEGALTATWKQDGRFMELRDPFAFIDHREQRWDVPARAQIDGASIPHFLWSITGSPYTGKYREASVIHDWFCSIRTRSSDATHAMFYEAMLVSGVALTKARVMYAAVRYAGPKWTDMDSHNANLASNEHWRPTVNYRWGTGGLPPMDTPAYEAATAESDRNRDKVRVRAEASEKEFQRVAEDIEARDLDLDAIDTVLASLPWSGTRVLEDGLYSFPDKSDLAEED